MAPLRSSLARTVGKLFGVSKDTDLSLRGHVQSSRRPPDPPVEASGGTKRTFGEYSFHVFTGNPTIDGPSSPYTFQVTSGGIPTTTYDIILVAGGGGGGDDQPGSYAGGGGGAGGVRFIPELPLSVATYPLVVAAGGSNANNGGDTIFLSLIHN